MFSVSRASALALACGQRVRSQSGPAGAGDNVKRKLVVATRAPSTPTVWRWTSGQVRSLFGRGTVSPGKNGNPFRTARNNVVLVAHGEEVFSKVTVTASNQSDLQFAKLIDAVATKPAADASPFEFVIDGGRWLPGFDRLLRCLRRRWPPLDRRTPGCLPAEDVGGVCCADGSTSHCPGADGRGGRRLSPLATRPRPIRTTPPGPSTSPATSFPRPPSGTVPDTMSSTCQAPM